MPSSPSHSLPSLPVLVAAVLACLAGTLAPTPGSAGTAGAAPSKATDRDRDRLPDRWERRHRLPTNRQSARRDPDRDRLNNRAELRHRVNPRRRDTDRDGMSDGYEVRVSRTDPRRPNRRRRGRGSALRDSAAPAATHFVDVASVGGACSDSFTAVQAASPASPWCSLGRAVALAPAGARVGVRGGSYPALTVRWDRRRSSHLTLAAVGGEVANLAAFKAEGTGFIRLEGFRISGGVTLQAGTHDIQIVGNDLSGSGIYMRSARNHLIEGNYIHDLAPDRAGLMAQGYSVDPATGGTRNLTIRRNHFARMSYDAIALFYEATDVLIEGNEIEQVRVRAGSSLHVDSMQIMYGRNITVRGNFVHDSTHGLIAKAGATEGLTIENNVFARLDSAAMNLWDAPGVRIVNNTVWDTHSGVLLRDDPAVPATTSATVASNVLDNLESPAAHLAYEDYNLIARNLVPSNAPRGPHDLLGDPRFISPTTLDYRLAAGSPAIDAAMSDLSPALDRAGRGRVDDPATANTGGGRHSFYDMGAHER